MKQSIPPDLPNFAKMSDKELEVYIRFLEASAVDRLWSLEESFLERVKELRNQLSHEIAKSQEVLDRYMRFAILEKERRAHFVCKARRFNSWNPNL